MLIWLILQLKLLAGITGRFIYGARSLWFVTFFHKDQI